jgi:glutamine amidotransferase/cyclase
MINYIRDKATIQVIESSSLGEVHYFSEDFTKTDVETPLAADICHRNKLPYAAVKKCLQDRVAKSADFFIGITV